MSHLSTILNSYVTADKGDRVRIKYADTILLNSGVR